MRGWFFGGLIVVVATAFLCDDVEAVSEHAGVPPDAPHSGYQEGDAGKSFPETDQFPTGFSLDGLYPSDTAGFEGPGDSAKGAVGSGALNPGDERTNDEAVEGPPGGIDQIDLVDDLAYLNELASEEGFQEKMAGAVPVDSPAGFVHPDVPRGSGGAARAAHGEDSTVDNIVDTGADDNADDSMDGGDIESFAGFGADGLASGAPGGNVAGASDAVITNADDEDTMAHIAALAARFVDTDAGEGAQVLRTAADFEHLTSEDARGPSAVFVVAFDGADDVAAKRARVAASAASRVAKNHARVFIVDAAADPAAAAAALGLENAHGEEGDSAPGEDSDAAALRDALSRRMGGPIAARGRCAGSWIDYARPVTSADFAAFAISLGLPYAPVERVSTMSALADEVESHGAVVVGVVPDAGAGEGVGGAMGATSAEGGDGAGGLDVRVAAAASIFELAARSFLADVKFLLVAPSALDVRTSARGAATSSRRLRVAVVRAAAVVDPLEDASPSVGDIVRHVSRALPVTPSGTDAAALFGEARPYGTRAHTFHPERVAKGKVAAVLVASSIMPHAAASRALTALEESLTLAVQRASSSAGSERARSLNRVELFASRAYPEREDPSAGDGAVRGAMDAEETLLSRETLHALGAREDGAVVVAWDTLARTRMTMEPPITSDRIAAFLRAAADRDASAAEALGRAPEHTPLTLPAGIDLSAPLSSRGDEALPAAARTNAHGPVVELAASDAAAELLHLTSKDAFVVVVDPPAHCATCAAADASFTHVAAEFSHSRWHRFFRLNLTRNAVPPELSIVLAEEPVGEPVLIAFPAGDKGAASVFRGDAAEPMRVRDWVKSVASTPVPPRPRVKIGAPGGAPIGDFLGDRLRDALPGLADDDDDDDDDDEAK